MTSGDDIPDLKRPHWPRPGASIAVFKQDMVLLVQRAKPPRTGLWSLPGGHVEPGERTSDTALRELTEETGIEARLAGLVTVHDALIHDASGRLVAHYVLAVYAGRWLAGNPVARSDAADARFFALQDLPQLPLMPHSADIIAAARRLVPADAVTAIGET